MSSLSQIPKPRLTTAPVAEPVSLTEAKKQCEIATADTAHDDHLALIIAAVRQQWEADTQEHLIAQTWELKLPYFCELQFPHRPVASITSVSYYDSGNSSQTLSTSVYELDAARNQLRLKYQQVFPATSDRWDAVTVTYVVGANASSTTVPAVAKQAMLLLIGYYFDANRGDNDKQYDMRAYEALVSRYMRSSYP